MENSSKNNKIDSKRWLIYLRQEVILKRTLLDISIQALQSCVRDVHESIWSGKDRMVILNRLKNSINDMSQSERWTVIAVVFLCFFALFALLRTNLFILFPLTPLLDYIFLQLAQTMMWAGAYAILKSYKLGYNEALRAAKFTIIEGEKYTLSPEELLRRSDQLDKVQSYLRTGISLLLGIGTALLLWTLNVELIPEYYNLLLMSASGVLTFFAVVAILFSFAQPSSIHGTNGLGEGLLPISHGKEQYCQELKEVIISKEYILKRMRTAIGMGLSLFILLLGLSVGFQTFYDISYQPAFPVDLVFLIPLGVMTAFFYSISFFVIGRPIFGIIEEVVVEETKDKVN